MSFNHFPQQTLISLFHSILQQKYFSSKTSLSTISKTSHLELIFHLYQANLAHRSTSRQVHSRVCSCLPPHPFPHCLISHKDVLFSPTHIAITILTWDLRIYRLIWSPSRWEKQLILCSWLRSPQRLVCRGWGC